VGTTIIAKTTNASGKNATGKGRRRRKSRRGRTRTTRTMEAAKEDGHPTTNRFPPTFARTTTKVVRPLLARIP
jgi:hypothetical protein